MATTDQIEPALTAEQWRYRFSLNDALVPIVESIHCRFAAIGTEATVPLPDVDLFGAMALCNAALPDDDQRKITAADVEEIRHAAGFLRDIAAKLAALLPPTA